MAFLRSGSVCATPAPQLSQRDVATTGAKAKHTTTFRNMTWDSLRAWSPDSNIYCEIFFDGEHNEFYGELSCKKKIPKLINYEDGHIQGRFNYLGEPLGDLYLLCSHYAEIGEEYYVFWSHSIHTSEKFGEKDFFDWVVWTPNSEHYNDIKKEQNA